MTAGVGPAIFISYRRQEASFLAGWLHDCLADHFGASRVFLDIDWIRPGAGFMAVIRQALASSRVVLVVIGRHWLDADQDGRRRLDRVDDPVRVEVETALRQQTQIIPLLLDDAAMPRVEDLPPSLADLATLNAQRVTYDSFRSDVNRLVQAIDLDRGDGTPRAAGPVEIAVEPPPAPGSPVPGRSEGQRDEYERARLLERLSRGYADHLGQVFDRSGAVEVELDLERDPARTTRPQDRIFRASIDRGSEPVPDGLTLLRAFDEGGGVHGDGLLVLGGPGAGKTTLLMQLGRQLGLRALRDPGHPLPVILHLSSWSGRRRPFGDWLAEQLVELYQVPESFARRWTVDGALLFLLDGLDEIPDRQDRISCVEAVNRFNRFGRSARVSTVVASRPVEYDALPIKLQLETAIAVRPVDAAAALENLEHGDGSARATAALVRHDPELLELLRSPLLISMLTLAYGDGPEADAPGVDDASPDRHHRLVSDYVRRRFELDEAGRDPRRWPGGGFTAERTRAWLSALAANLTRDRQTVVVVGRTPIDWLPARWARMVVVALPGPLTGLGVAVIDSVIRAAQPEVSGSDRLGEFLVGVFILMLHCGMGALLALLFVAEGRSGRHISWKWARMRSRFRMLISFGLAYGLLNWLTQAGIASIMIGFQGVQVPVSLLGMLAIGTLFALLVGGVNGLHSGLGVGIVVGLMHGLTFSLLAFLWDVSSGSKGAASTANAAAVHELWPIGLMLGLIAGISAGLTGRPQPAEYLSWSYSRVRSRLPTIIVVGSIIELSTASAFWEEGGFGRLFGVLVGLLGFAGAFVISGIDIGSVPLHVTPNEATRRSARSGVLVMLMISLIVGVPVGLYEGVRNGVLVGVSNGLTLGLIAGLVCGVAFGLGAVAQHALLRVLLAVYGLAPIRYVHWLDHAVRLRLLYRDASGGYIFIHRVVQDHFANSPHDRAGVGRP